MDPISQGALGAVASQVAPGREKLRAVAFLGCIAGMAPDLDVFIGSSSDPLLFLEYHRQFTHALVFIPVGAALVALPLHPFVRRTLRLRQTYLACLLGYATHGLLDACTSYGTQLLWPFSDVRVAWSNVSIVDPLFTLPLLCLVILAAVRRRRALAVAGLIWAIGYLLLGVVQHQRAETAGEQLAAERGHRPHRLSVKAGFANLLVWKVVYEHDGRFHVDGIRAGPAVTVCPGASIARLDVRRDFPWLDPDSRQARDVERFRRFSDGYVAVDPHVPNRIVDMRYSMVPNTIDPLWGIELDPEAPPDRHVRYLEVRESRPEQRGLYWRLLTGEGCRALDSMRAGVETLSHATWRTSRSDSTRNPRRVLSARLPRIGRSRYPGRSRSPGRSAASRSASVRRRRYARSCGAPGADSERQEDEARSREERTWSGGLMGTNMPAGNR